MEQPITFEPISFRMLKKTLDGVQAPNSVCSCGERIAASVLSKSHEELSKLFTDKSADDEAFHKMIEVLVNTEQCLEGRLELVSDALIRIAFFTDIAPNDPAGTTT